MSAEVPLLDATQSRPIQLDIAKYRAHLDSLELTDEQAAEFLTVLWHIMIAFVDLGFGVDAVQCLLPEMHEGSAEQGAEPTDQDT